MTQEQLKPEMPELRMNAYYYSFSKTGVTEIDIILSAIASAGKAYHHTESWHDDTQLYDQRFIGKTPIEWIQNAANDAAKLYRLPDHTAALKEAREALEHAHALITVLRDGGFARNVDPAIDQYARAISNITAILGGV